MDYCNHGANANDPCPDCIREQDGRPKPDRAARIRALAERMLAALNATKFEPDLKRDEATYRGLAGGCFRAAGWCTDELDRLEREEREKGAGDGAG